MESKKVNWLYLSIILVYIGAVVAINIIYVASRGLWDLGIAANFILSELLILGPGIFFLVICRQPWNDWLNFRKIKLSSFFMCLLYTFLLMPLTTLLNAISMLFVENEVSASSGEILGMPFWMMFFLIAMYGPFCEEFVFRGIIYGGYKKTGPVFWSIILSAVLFGLMHMNFNQAPYAFALGAMFALLMEATGSLWSSVIAHMLFNGWSVCQMYLIEFFIPGYMSQIDPEAVSKESMLIAIGPYMLVATAATAIAICVLVWIAKNENRLEHLRSVWNRRKVRNGRLISVPLIIAIALCLTFMIFEVVMNIIFG